MYETYKCFYEAKSLLPQQPLCLFESHKDLQSLQEE